MYATGHHPPSEKTWQHVGHMCSKRKIVRELRLGRGRALLGIPGSCGALVPKKPRGAPSLRYVDCVSAATQSGTTILIHLSAQSFEAGDYVWLYGRMDGG